jgi:hypothetical protein|tara:strand:+ start:493 stop:1458 length:966 start_codon:yes stop_codon:yes gene_type:complete
MADRNKFEQMLEKLVNEDKKGAEELFHDIVVEKSRSIYENLLEDELADESKDEDTNEATDEEVDESSKDEEVDEAKDEETDESKDENVDEAKDEEVDEASKDENVDENFAEITPEAEDDMGGDPADDMMADIEGGDDAEGDDNGDDEDMEDRVVDLEDALDDLKAEFEKMMGDKEEGDDEDSEEAPMDDMGDDEEKEEEAFAPESDLSVADEVPAFEGTKSNTEQMREYVEKIAEPKGEDNKAKSPVAGANNMGGTTANIAKGSSEEKGGTVSAPKTEDGGNVNVPGGKASKSMSNAKGHGAEKKGAGETGTDGKSIIGSK